MESTPEKAKVTNQAHGQENVVLKKKKEVMHEGLWLGDSLRVF